MSHTLRQLVFKKKSSLWLQFNPLIIDNLINQEVS